MNRLFGYRGVSGYQLGNVVKHNMVGKPPPNRGQKLILSNNVFDLLCHLFLSKDAVKQANGKEQNDFGQNASLLGRIVNEKRRCDGESDLNEVHLYRRIEKANSSTQDMIVLEVRESHRHFWLMYHNQKRNHINWEKANVCLGIAHLLIDDKENKREGNIIFERNGEDTKNNVLFFDETATYLDASESAAGRKASFASDNNIPNVGKAGSKSSDKFTLLVAVNGVGELLPFMTIIPSSAKEEDWKLNLDTILGYKQLEGKYGCLMKQTHSCTFASRPKG